MPTLSQLPKYADLFRYIGMPAIYNSQAELDRDKVLAPDLLKGAYTGTQGYYTTEQQGGGEGGTQDVQVWHPGTFNESADIPDQYKGIMSFDDRSTAESGPSGQSNFQLNKAMIDKYPKTRFGSVDTVAYMGSGEKPGAVQGTYGQTDLMNPNASYYDENYGWITPKANLTNKSETRSDAMTQAAIKMIMSMGMGALMAPVAGASFLQSPSFATSLVQAAPGFDQPGGWKNAAMGIGSSLLGAGVGGNLPPELTDAFKYMKTGYGLYGAAKSRDPVSGAMTLAKLYQMFNG